jgi:hypothetical protein
VSEVDLKVDVPKFINHVKNKSRRQDLSTAELTDSLQQRLKKSEKVWHVARGHDVVDFLCFAFRKTLGNLKAQEVTPEHIERGLRLAYPQEDFSQTQLYSKIRAWEAAHVPFRVFHDARQKALQF